MFSVKTEWLDGRHVVFGQIVDGMDVVKKVKNLSLFSLFLLKFSAICIIFHYLLHPRLRAWAQDQGKPVEKSWSKTVVKLTKETEFA